jgi:2,5-diketo-D-gluconate reductase A
MSQVPTVTLNNGVGMPQLGLGVARVSDSDAVAAVSTALQLGYRSVDTATDYGNEAGVGKALTDSGIAREDLFITTKVANPDQGRAASLDALRASLDRLGLAYVDLYLIHWPVPQRALYVDTWLALEQLYAAGLTRAIGVSNFEPNHLADLISAGSIVPAVNQIELHPLLQQRTLRAQHRQLGIATEAWSPFAKGQLLAQQALALIAARHHITPAQVALRWHLQIGNIVIPKTVTTGRMKENLVAAGLPALDEDDMLRINALDNNGRIGPHPNDFA